MNLTGKSLIGDTPRGEGDRRFAAINPATGAEIPPRFIEATNAELDHALKLANAAFDAYRALPRERVAEFLDEIALAIEALGDELLHRCNLETALPIERLISERTRTINHLRMFAAEVREGSYVDARIETAIPDRRPTPKPDLRRMLIPIGPVVVFGASNFPLAYSVGGGDTASALAAGCPVVFKAHPAHPGTCEMVAAAIVTAAKKTGMPRGVFAMLHGGKEVGEELVRHPLTRAVAFTGSLRVGRALFDAAAARPVPIPVFAEMGSVNPVFILPGALRDRARQIAEGLANAVTYCAGQFCTKPGVVAGLAGSEFDAFCGRVTQLAGAVNPMTMLTPGLAANYRAGVEAHEHIAGVTATGQSTPAPVVQGAAGSAVIMQVRDNIFS